tara:strand:+ start:2376 stop:3212 length:837 start_codon:yes stop_codon:yes gene_type:complete
MKVIIGDNPFFGVNHKIGSKALEDESIRFKQALEVLTEAKNFNCSNLMITNHPNISKFLDLIDRNNLSELELAFIAPYPHKYNDLVAKEGYLGLAKHLLAGNFKYIISNFYKFFDFKRTQDHIVRMVCNSELESLGAHKSKVRYMCLHNILVDMYVASGNYRALEAFVHHVNDLGLEPVLITQNIVALTKIMRINKGYTICFSYNAAGYMVNPSINIVDNFLDEESTSLPNLWAMQIMGSGAVNLNDALSKVFAKNKFSGILYATTKKERVTELFNTI